MFSITKTAAVTLFLGAAAFLGGCSSDVSGSSDDPKSIPIDDSPITAANATGLWQLHYEWESTPSEAWTTFFGSASSGDLSVALPSETQKRGMFAAETTWGFAPMSSTIADGEVKWTFSLNGAGGKTFTLDFTGSGTADAIKGSAKFSNASGSASWTAKKVTSVMIAPKELAGDWTVDFQWARRTPGQLLVTCDATGNCKIPGGQDGGPTKDEPGIATFNGNQFTLKYAGGATHVGVATKDGLFWGYMDATDGNTGVWKATRGKPAPEQSSDGCTADVDCGSCQRCERSTGSCISRLTC